MPEWIFFKYASVHFGLILPTTPCVLQGKMSLTLFNFLLYKISNESKVIAATAMSYYTLKICILSVNYTYNILYIYIYICIHTYCSNVWGQYD